MSAVLENTPVTNMQIVSTHLAVTTASVNKAMRVMDIIASVSEILSAYFADFIRRVKLIAST
jgi:hypothetical protein